MRIISKEKYEVLVKRHCYTTLGCKIRTNSFGISFCVYCGRLYNYNTISKPLEENDKLLIKI